MREHQIAPPKGATGPRWRIGRGHGSGSGTTAGKGTKGQKSRRGVTIRPGFEGGQLPLIKRLPRLRGFRNAFRKEYQPVNIGALAAKFEDGAVITPEEMAKAGLLHDLKKPVKILGDGDLEKKLIVSAHKFSAAAKRAIEAGKGTAEEIDAATATV